MFSLSLASLLFKALSPIVRYFFGEKVLNRFEAFVLARAMKKAGRGGAIEEGNKGALDRIDKTSAAVDRVRTDPAYRGELRRRARGKDGKR